jgi:hypothetical protein
MPYGTRDAPHRVMDDRKDPNQGEGDRESARRYDRHVEEFVAKGKVRRAAQGAERYIEKDPEGAARAERTARRGPHAVKSMIEGIIAKGRALFDAVYEGTLARLTAMTRKH